MTDISQVAIIRKATLEDAGTIAEIICSSWKAAYSAFLPSEILQKHTDIANRTEKLKSILSTDNAWNIHLAIMAKTACGTISYGKNRESDCGEIYFCYAKPEMWGLGIGHSMMEFALADLRRQGYQEVILWVFEANTQARRFYERQGFITDGAVNEGSHGAREVRYRRTI
jgi:RimJ/RimL family protein N-acetyltransferase